MPSRWRLVHHAVQAHHGNLITCRFILFSNLTQTLTFPNLQKLPCLIGSKWIGKMQNDFCYLATCGGNRKHFQYCSFLDSPSRILGFGMWALDKWGKTELKTVTRGINSIP